MAFRFGRRGREVAALKAEVDELRSRLDAGNGVVSRRGLLRTAGAAAAGAVAGAVASAAPASAADSSPMIVGANANDNPGLTTTLSGSTSASNSSMLSVTQLGTASAIAIQATATASNGVGVLVNADIMGVHGKAANADGVGIQGTGLGTRAIGVRAISQNNAPLLLGSSSITMPPTSNDWEGGSLLGRQQHRRSGTATTPAAEPASKWVKLISVLQMLAAPFRVYDSRVGQTNPSGSPQGKLAFGAAARTINCTPALPALNPATTILFNLTVVNTVGASSGALLVWSAGVTQPTASSINWKGAGVQLGERGDVGMRRLPGRASEVRVLHRHEHRLHPRRDRLLPLTATVPRPEPGHRTQRAALVS